MPAAWGGSDIAAKKGGNKQVCLFAPLCVCVCLSIVLEYNCQQEDTPVCVCECDEHHDDLSGRRQSHSCAVVYVKAAPFTIPSAS